MLVGDYYADLLPSEPGGRISAPPLVLHALLGLERTRERNATRRASEPPPPPVQSLLPVEDCGVPLDKNVQPIAMIRERLTGVFVPDQHRRCTRLGPGVGIFKSRFPDQHEIISV
jgi:hypothetical protein